MFGVSLAAIVMALPVETIGTRFGGVPSGLPQVQFPSITWSVLPDLLMPAMTVAMLGAIESLLSATVADRMTGTRHNPNVELIAQGIGTSSRRWSEVCRRPADRANGDKHPVGSQDTRSRDDSRAHALAHSPVRGSARCASTLAVLAGLLFIVAYNMGEWHEIPTLLKMTKADIAVWFATFALTVLADLTVAVEVGMVLAALLFIRRVAETTSVARVTGSLVEEGRLHSLQGVSIPDYAAVYRIHGPFLFGATDKLTASRSSADAPAHHHHAASACAGDGRVRIAGTCGSCRSRAAFRPHVAAVWGAPAAGALDGPCRVPCARRGGEYSRQRPRCDATRERDCGRARSRATAGARADDRNRRRLVTWARRSSCARGL